MAVNQNHVAGDQLIQPIQAEHKRKPCQRIFVNRSLFMDKIKFYGFDMDYTLAEYRSPEYEKMGFDMIKNYLVELGYPPEISDLQYNAEFSVRGLWWDNLHGNMLKVDGFGNILSACHGLRFLRPDEINERYPNKFIQLNEKRIFVYNTLFNLPEIYLLASIIEFFVRNPEYKEIKEGFKWKDVVMSYNSIFQDVRNAVDHVHMRGDLKDKTCENLDLYIQKDERLPQMLYNLQASGAKTFLLTNSEWKYTNQVMTYLMDVPNAPRAGEHWQAYFDYTFVDAKKPLFFGEGTVMRQVNKTTGQLRIGHHTGNIEKDAVYSGGNSEVLTRLMGARGRDVLYTGDHIFGDVLMVKKLRGWRTFLIVPELNDELNVWTTKKHLFENLQNYDQQLSELYLNLDSSNRTRPEEAELARRKMKETIHEMEMAYGTTGSLFRSGSRQTFFSSQVVRYADLYAATCLNLLFYPTFYMFRAPHMLMPHESTVAHEDQAGLERSRRPLLGRENSHHHHAEGQEPTITHDIDDDEINDDTESGSEKDN